MPSADGPALHDSEQLTKARRRVLEDEINRKKLALEAEQARLASLSNQVQSMEFMADHGLEQIRMEINRVSADLSKEQQLL